MRNKLSVFLKKSAYWTSVIVLGAALGASLQFAKAWVEPTADPPAGNVDAAINTGSAGQYKVGGLTLNTGGAPTGLIVQEGNVSLGTTAANYPLTVYSGTENHAIVVSTDSGEAEIILNDGEHDSTWEIGVGSMGYHVQSFDPITHAERGYALRIANDNDQNVGIGTDPDSTYKLKVGGRMRASSYISSETGMNAPQICNLTGGGCVTISSAGNVGMGVASAGAKLEVNGGIRVGNDSTCNSSKGGTIRYTGTSMQYCNGTSWTNM
jgi:hypothetical protein